MGRKLQWTITMVATIEPRHDVHRVIAGGQDQHGNQVVLAAQRPENLHAVHAREHQVQQQQVVGVGARQMQAIHAFGGHIHGEAGAFLQHLGNVLGQSPLILNNQYPHVQRPTAKAGEVRFSSASFRRKASYCWLWSIGKRYRTASSMAS